MHNDARMPLFICKDFLRGFSSVDLVLSFISKNSFLFFSCWFLVYLIGFLNFLEMTSRPLLRKEVDGGLETPITCESQDVVVRSFQMLFCSFS